MKRLCILSTVLLLLCALPLLASAAESGTCGASLTWTVEDGALVVSGSGDMDDYASASRAPWGTGITSAVIGDGVTSVGAYAFYKCASLTDVTLPDSLTRIGRAAFLACESLAGLSLPSPVLEIGDYAFDGCAALTGSAVLPEGVTCVGAFLFFGCAGLEEIVLPDSVSGIGMWAFYGCRGLKSVTVPDSVASVGARAFLGCGAVRYASVESAGAKALGLAGYSFRSPEHPGIELKYIYTDGALTGLGILSADADAESVEIPCAVTEIAPGAFDGCGAVLYARVGCDGAKALGREGLSFLDLDDPRLEYLYAFTDGVRTGLTLLRAETSVTSLALPDGVTEIGDGALAGCADLTEITLPQSLERIGEEAFSGCVSLASVTVPDGTVSVGTDAFRDCGAVLYARVPAAGAMALGRAGYSFRDADEPRVEYLYTFSGDTAEDLILLRADADLDALSVPDGVTAIADGAFLGCAALTGLTLPQSLGRIGERAFSGCAALGEISIPHSVTDIGWYAFYGCESLSAVRLPDSLTGVGWYLFFGCRSLVSVVIPNGVTVIGRSAFSGCSGLSEVRIPEGVVSIGSHAFYNCASLARISLPPGLSAIADYLLFGCAALTEVTIPSGVTKIGSGAFSGCSGLTRVTVPRGAVSIGANAFKNAGLSEAVLPSTVRTIDKSAFDGNEGMIVYCYGGSAAEQFALDRGFEVRLLEEALAFLTLPRGLTDIESGAFDGMDGCLFILPASLVSIAPDAFPKGAVLSVVSGSPAQEWAEANGFDVAVRQDGEEGS